MPQAGRIAFGQMEAPVIQSQAPAAGLVTGVGRVADRS